MLTRTLALLAACSMAATPCLAAELPGLHDQGERRSGAVAGAYFKVPLTGGRAATPRAGLRLATTHDYRTAQAPGARMVEADAFDLRLAGQGKPALYLAGKRVTGDKPEYKLGPTGTISLVIIGLAVVGGFVVYQAIDDSGEE